MVEQQQEKNGTSENLMRSLTGELESLIDIQHEYFKHNQEADQSRGTIHCPAGRCRELRLLCREARQFLGDDIPWYLKVE